MAVPIHVFYSICLLSQVLHLSADSCLILNYNVLITFLLGYLLYGKDKNLIFFNKSNSFCSILGGVPSLSSD